MSEILGRSAGDVRRWPQDARARRALEEYFGQPATGPNGVHMLEVPLEARGLDFSGAELDGARIRLTSCTEADLRHASLRSCRFDWASFTRARSADCDVAGATGELWGPIDVGADSPHLLDGVELREWLAARGAPEADVLQRTRSR